MCSPVQKVQTLVDDFDIDVLLNALQQICFCNSDEQRFENNTTAADYWLSLGKKLDPAIKSASS